MASETGGCPKRRGGRVADGDCRGSRRPTPCSPLLTKVALAVLAVRLGNSMCVSSRQSGRSGASSTFPNWLPAAGCSPGIRAPSGGSGASIICNSGAHGRNPTPPWGPEVLHYVGRGLEGDQALDRDNESLRLAIERGAPIHIFDQLGKNRHLPSRRRRPLAGDKPRRLGGARALGSAGGTGRVRPRGATWMYRLAS